MSRRLRKLAKRGRKLRELDDRARHTFRINAKKLRYASEFFASLYDGRKATGRRKALDKALKKLQDQLGPLNDAAVHERVSFELVTAGDVPSPERSVRQAYAAGAVNALEGQAAGDAMDLAQREASRLSPDLAFWT